MGDRTSAILHHLAATRAELLDAVSGLGDDDWDRRIASDEGAWAIRQLLAHVASAEPGQLATGRRMLAGEARLGDGFSLDVWNRRQVEKLKDRSPAELLSDLSASRQTLLAWIAGLSDTDLDKSGQHARGDFITVEQLCYRIGEHEAGHAEQILAALARPQVRASQAGGAPT